MLSRVCIVFTFVCVAMVSVCVAPMAAPGMSIVHVVAHQDDDILFMNPDLANSIDSGALVTSVYLTAGESDVVPPQRYAARRQAGTRAAYAHMAGVANVWDAVVLPIEVGRSVELYTLRAKPTVRLIFLNLPDDNSPHAVGGKHTLTRLWEQGNAWTETLIPQGSPLRTTSRYRRDDVISTLTWLYRHLGARVIRTHDPLPDPRDQPQWGRFHNHPDHVITARFADAARQRYRGPARLMHYRDYNIADTPANLAAELVRRKRETFRHYAAHDPMVSMAEPYASWLRSTRPRWEPGADWAAVDRQGRLVTATVSDGELVVQRWHPNDTSERVIAATPGFEPIAGSQTVLRHATGGVVLLVQSRTTHDVWLMWMVDGQPDRWHNLGAPSGRGGTHPGMPAALCCLPHGNLLLAAKNARGGVSVQITDPGTPSAGGWRDVGGTDVVDGVTVVSGRDARPHVFAATRGGLLHWTGQADGSFVLRELPHRPAGRLASAGNGGLAYLAFRAADTGEIMLLGESAGWDVTAVIPEPGLRGPAVAVRDDGSVLLAADDARGHGARFQVSGAGTVVEAPDTPHLVAATAFTPDGGSFVTLTMDGNVVVRRLGMSARSPAP